MPSEDSNKEVALEALSDPIENYRSAVATTAEQVRGFLAAHRGDETDDDSAPAAELGAYAVGRIDMDRFENLLSGSREKEEPDTLRKVEKAFAVLRRLSSGGDDGFYVKVKPGARLREAVAGRLAEIGRGFAAARIAGLAALGALTDGQAEALLEPLGFDAWNKGERRLAPPLVVELEGADLCAADLAEFLDGNMKIVLLVNGDAPPAPLVRLITPRTFVAQTSNPSDLDRFAATKASAVAALMPAGAARFVHDPAGGALLRDRLEILQLPDKPPRKKVGGASARQQEEELDQLRTLAECSAAAGATAGASQAPAHEVTSVEKLGAWLLTQTDLNDME
jgi:hypothetical protein